MERWRNAKIDRVWGISFFEVVTETIGDVSPFGEEENLGVFDWGCKSQFRQFRHEICERHPDLEIIVVKRMHGRLVVVGDQKAQNDLLLVRGCNDHCDWV